MTSVNLKVKIIRDILPVYRYSELREFYNKCNTAHSRLAKNIIDRAIKNGFETPFEIDGGYYIFSSAYQDYTGDIPETNNVSLIVDYYDKEDNNLTYIDINNNTLTVFLNKRYTNKYLVKYDKSIMSDLFYFEYCTGNNIVVDNIAVYTRNLVNDIHIKEIDFYFVKKMILLLSPSERLTRREHAKEKIDKLTNELIDIICYGEHGMKRICGLINYVVDNCYYNMFHFFIFHFIDQDPELLKYVYYLGYFLTKLGVYDFGITKEYISKVTTLDYKHNHIDLEKAKIIYDYVDNYFNEYLYDYYKIILEILDANKEDITK